MPKQITFWLLESAEQSLCVQRAAMFIGLGYTLDQCFEVVIKVFIHHFLDARAIEGFFCAFQDRQTTSNGKVALTAIDQAFHIGKSKG